MSSNKKLGIRPCTWVYLFLMFFSFVTFLIGQMGFSGLQVALGVLFLALIKGQLVGHYFMGLGSVRGIWRLARLYLALHSRYVDQHRVLPLLI